MLKIAILYVSNGKKKFFPRSDILGKPKMPEVRKKKIQQIIHRKRLYLKFAAHYYQLRNIKNIFKMQ